MVLGALVADAASLGLHWLYDVNRIAEIEQKKGWFFSSLMPITMPMVRATTHMATNKQARLRPMVKLAC